MICLAETVRPTSASMKTVTSAIALHLMAATESNTVKRMRRIERVHLDLPHVMFFNIAQFSISDRYYILVTINPIIITEVIQ